MKHFAIARDFEEGKTEEAVNDLLEENEKRLLEAQDWEDEYHALKRRYEELDKSALEKHELLMDTAAKFQAVSKELEEARKISFPRQPDGKGGWTIEYKYLERIEQEVSQTSGYESSMEQIQEVLLMVERMSVGQEGEGNRRTIEVTLTNAGYKEHELKFEEQGEIEVENKLTLWYNIEKREAVIKSVKANIQKRYGFSDGEFVSIGGGFKFLFDDETNGEISITFIEEKGNLKVTVEGTWPWEVIEVYNHCLPQSAEEDPA